MNWVLLKNSLLLSGFTTIVAVTVGVLAALSLAGLPRLLRGIALGMVLATLALPPFLVTNCWLHFLGLTGVWRGWLPLNIISLGGTIWILSLLLWPVTLVATLSAWHRLEPAQLESDLAVSGWHLFSGLLLPLARPSVVSAAMLTFVLALNNFAVPALLQVHVYPAEMWVRFNTAFDTRGALQLSWPLVLGPLLLLAWFARRDPPWPHLQAGVSGRLLRQQLGAFLSIGSGVFTVLLLCLSLGLPLAQILSARRTWLELAGAVAAGQSAIWNSFWLAAVSATVVVLLSLLFCPFLSPRRFRVFDAFGWLCWLPFLVPGVLLGLGLVLAFNRSWCAVFYQSAAIVILAFAVRYLAVGWNAVARASRRVDRDLVEVARLAGAGRWQTFRHAYWPQLAPHLAAVWYVVFLLGLWDVESMILIAPPGTETLALRIFNLLHYGHSAQVNALCLTLLAIALLPLILWKTCGLLRETCFANRSLGVNLLVGSACLGLLAGCSPKSSAPFHSQIFSEVRIIGSRGVGVGQLNKPRSVAVDSHDNLYVVDMTGRVQKFCSNGVFLLSWQMPQTDLGKPKGMCRDQAGNIIVIEPHYSRVNHFSPAGLLLAQWGERGTNSGQLSVPRAAAVNSRGEIFVSEYQQTERVQKFVFDGPLGTNPATMKPPRWVASFGHSGTSPGELNRAEGLCVDAEDRVYVADSCNHRIQVFSSEGKFLSSYGKPGRGAGELSYPYDICVDAAGRQYVCEFGNSRIQIFDANGRSIEILGGPGAEPGQFANPWGVALDSAGNLYVADSQNHRVQKLIRRAALIVRK